MDKFKVIFYGLLITLGACAGRTGGEGSSLFIYAAALIGALIILLPLSLLFEKSAKVQNNKLRNFLFILIGIAIVTILYFGPTWLGEAMR
jgi:hypothetical protein